MSVSSMVFPIETPYSLLVYNNKNNRNLRIYSVRLRLFILRVLLLIGYSAVFAAVEFINKESENHPYGKENMSQCGQGIN